MHSRGALPKRIQDYDDVTAGVDAALALGFVDPECLYVTGGFGGGISKGQLGSDVVQQHAVFGRGKLIKRCDFRDRTTTDLCAIQRISSNPRDSELTLRFDGSKLAR